MCSQDHDFEDKPNMEEEEHSHNHSQEEVKSFEELGVCQPLLEACAKLGWIVPSIIQAKAIPHALQGKDIIGLAQTGSGKTGAFALPIIQSLLDAEPPQSFFACVLSPTRDLAIQIAEQFEALGASIGLKTAVLVGGVDMNQQQIALGKRPHIIVATPGRLMDHLSNIKGFSLRTLKYLVLDEADRLLNADFEKVLDDILKVIPLQRRTFLFSATMTNKHLSHIVVFGFYVMNAAFDTDDCYLVYILMEMSGRAMVFTEKCDSTLFLAQMLRNLGLRALAINGLHMTQAQRFGALNKFKSGDCNILVCTRVANRGLDTAVDMVINYDMPPDSKDYIHQVGRTARAGKTGVAISLVNQYELERFILIEKLVGQRIQKHPAEEEEVLALLERVNEASRISHMKMKESRGKKKRSRERDDEEEEIQRYMNKGNKFGRNLKKLRR